VGIVTDRDLRDKVLATEETGRQHTGRHECRLITVDAREYCFEALLK